MSHAITPSDHRDPPRCCECGLPLHGIHEPFTGGVAQHHRCEGCREHLHVRRGAGGWTVCTAAQHAGQRTAPLPAVASPALRGRFLTACRSVGQLLRGDGVEPGMAAINQQEAR